MSKYLDVNSHHSNWETWHSWIPICTFLKVTVQHKLILSTNTIRTATDWISCGRTFKDAEVRSRRQVKTRQDKSEVVITWHSHVSYQKLFVTLWRSFYKVRLCRVTRPHLLNAFSHQVQFPFFLQFSRFLCHIDRGHLLAVSLAGVASGLLQLLRG